MDLSQRLPKQNGKIPPDSSELWLRASESSIHVTKEQSCWNKTGNFSCHLLSFMGETSAVWILARESIGLGCPSTAVQIIYVCREMTIYNTVR